MMLVLALMLVYSIELACESVQSRPFGGRIGSDSERAHVQKSVLKSFISL